MKLIHCLMKANQILTKVSHLVLHFGGNFRKIAPNIVKLQMLHFLLQLIMNSSHKGKYFIMILTEFETEIMFLSPSFCDSHVVFPKVKDP